MKKNLVLLSMIILVVVVMSCTGKTGQQGPVGPAGPQQPGLYYVKNFQDSVYPANYNGQVQASITSWYSAATYTANTEPLWFGTIKVNAYTEYIYRVLLKFDLSSIPASKIIIDKAELTLKTNSNIIGSGVMGAVMHKLTNNWAPFHVGWSNRTSLDDFWNISYGGGDFDSNTMTVNAASFDIGPNQTVTIDLDPEVVRSWTENPAENYGMILIAGDEAAGKYVEFYPSGDPTPANRPLLKVSYYTTE